MNFLNNLRRQKFLSFTVVLLTLSVGVLIGTLLNTGVKAARDASAPGATPLQVGPATQTQNSFSSIAKMLEPSVVNISSEYIQKASAKVTPRNPHHTTPQSPDDEGGMEDFFRRFFNSPGGPSPDDSQRGASLGSGFVVDRSGYILTNNHVVEKANRIRVKFNGDSTEYEAKVIGTDWQTDLAVIKIDKTNLVPVKVGNSDAIQVGDWAVAIGSPFGFQETVTAGIISAKSRDIPGDSTSFQHFLQTDAAINPGNSGGPLLDTNGAVIGINTQIASRSGGYQGIGFAMPINTAVYVYNQIIRNGKVTRGSIGISFNEGPNTQELLRAYNAKHGVFVRTVEPNGPAEKAGLKPEDVITEINGHNIMKGSDLIDIVAESPVGSTISMNYLRDGKPESATVTVGDRAKIFAKEQQPGGELEQTPEDNGQDEGTQARFGMTIQPLTSQMKDNLGIKAAGGVVVQSVEPGSFAEDLGLAQGDIVTAINRTPITSTEQLKAVQSKLKTGDAVALKVLRNAGGPQKPSMQPLYLAGTVPAAGQ